MTVIDDRLARFLDGTLLESGGFEAFYADLGPRPSNDHSYDELYGEPA